MHLSVYSCTHSVADENLSGATVVLVACFGADGATIVVYYKGFAWATGVVV